MLPTNDTLGYYYEAGIPKIRIENNALTYYSWKMFWFNRENPRDTTIKEIGLMTFNARKIDSNMEMDCSNKPVYPLVLRYC